MKPENNFVELGKIAWLWMNSRLHGGWSTRLMTRNVIPPISLRQYRILHAVDGDHPVAYASWAFFSAEAEKRYIISPSKITLEDWNSGDRMWFIDYVSPFSIRDTVRLKSELRDIFPDRYARALRVYPGSDTAKILTFFGEHVPAGWREEAEGEILSHFATRKKLGQEQSAMA